MRKITIIGTGYVGLVTGACLADMGNQVTCLDIDRKKIDSLKQAKVPFFEPGLEDLVQKGIKSSLLTFTTDYSQAIPGCEFCFLALPTPSNHDESCDVSYVLQAAKQLAENMDGYLVVITKSTVPVGTAEKVRQTIANNLKDQNVDFPFDVVSNPEFLAEGVAIKNYLHPERIIIGVDSSRAEKQMKELYASYLDRLQVMDIPSAELSKYAANGMLALRISYMNDLAGLCEKLGANIESIKQAISADPRIGKNHLNPGIGFGGSCLPKDVRALRSMAKLSNHPSSLYDSILEINIKQREAFVSKITHYFDNLEGKTFAIWGLSFKPNTDDLREAPALYLIQSLLERGAKIKVYDPVAMPKAGQLLPREVQFCDSEYEAAEKAHAILLITEWAQFKQADFAKIGPTMTCKALFDGRNQYSPTEMENLGFDYFCVGRR